jgi:hypothetical protein
MTVTGRDDLAALDYVWAIESGQEIAVNRIYFQHNHGTGNEFTWPEGLGKLAQKGVDAVTEAAPSGGNNLQHYLSSKVALTRCDAYAQWGADGKATQKETVTPASTLQGGNTGGAVPPHLAVVVGLWAFTGFDPHQRRKRGRMFLPPVGETYIGDDGRIDTNTITALTDTMTAFFNDLQGAHANDGTGPALDFWNVGVYSRADNTFNQLQAVTVSKDFAVQRRRLNKLTVPTPYKGTINH